MLNRSAFENLHDRESNYEQQYQNYVIRCHDFLQRNIGEKFERIEERIFFNLVQHL